MIYGTLNMCSCHENNLVPKQVTLFCRRRLYFKCWFRLFFCSIMLLISLLRNFSVKKQANTTSSCLSWISLNSFTAGFSKLNIIFSNWQLDMLQLILQKVCIKSNVWNFAFICNLRQRKYSWRNRQNAKINTTNTEYKYQTVEYGINK